MQKDTYFALSVSVWSGLRIYFVFFFQWGYGNWKEIAHHIETKTPEQTKQEYLRNYIYGVVGRYTWKEELRGYQIDHTQVNLLNRVNFKINTFSRKKYDHLFRTI